MPRIALITGGSRGLGRAAAEALAATGVDVIVTYRTGSDEAAAVVAGIEAGGGKAAALPLDTRDFASYAAFGDALRSTLATTFGRDSLDILVNNAGFAGVTALGSTDAETIDALYEVHVKAVVLLTQLVAPLLVDGGRVLNVSTGLTRFVVNDGYSVYAAMKGAVEVYTRYLAKTLGARGIAVNAIAPGATATDFAGGAVRDSAQYRTAIAGATAMGRVGEASDIGAAVAAILAESAGWITGQRIEASGGQSI